MLNFTFHLPTRILFGPGKLAELQTTSHLPKGRALVVVTEGGSMHRHGYLGKILTLLGKRGVETVIWNRIQPNPWSDDVDQGAALARMEKCDFVVGLGGGSAIDSAKAIAFMAANPGEYWDYMPGGSGAGRTPLNPPLPVVAIPTTSGTGTEADPWMVISRSGHREKIGWGAENTYPVLSIVDPELTVTLPPDQTAFTGMDAFFHAVEAYLSTRSQPMSDLLALEAVGIIASNLPVAVRKGEDIKVRTSMSWASTAAGVCESLSSCISHHSLAHALSAFYPELPHGAALCMIAPAYFEWLAVHNPERFEDLAFTMGEDVEGLSEQDRPYAFVTGLLRLLDSCGLSEFTLKAAGVRESDLPVMARNALDTMGGLFELTPAKMTQADVLEIFTNAYRHGNGL